MKQIFVKDAFETLMTKTDKLTRTMIKATIGEANLGNMSSEELQMVVDSFDLMDECRKTYKTLADAIDNQTVALAEIMEKLNKLEDK